MINKAFMAVSLEKEEKRREKWGRKGTPYTCFGEFQNIASHAHRLSHCTWVKQSTGTSANMPQEPKLAL